MMSPKKSLCRNSSPPFKWREDEGGIKMEKKYWEDFTAGEEVTTQSITITDAHLVNWAGLTMDFYPLHMDEEYAKKTIFKDSSWAINLCNGDWIDGYDRNLW